MTELAGALSSEFPPAICLSTLRVINGGLEEVRTDEVGDFRVVVVCHVVS